MSLVVSKLAAVAAGGALGASLRYVIAAIAHQILGHGFPYGTLAVNVLGSLIIGYFLVLLPQQEGGVSTVHLFLVTGLLGGFTTYSAFSVETLQLAQDGQLHKAGLNILITLLACLTSVWGGFVLARIIHSSS